MEIMEKLEYYTSLVMKLHGKQKRKHDENIPYFTHPIGCACWALEDNNGNISSEDRQKAAIVLLFHDVLEDTNTTEEELKSYLKMKEEEKDEIIGLIKLCTNAKNISSKEEYEKLKKMNIKELPEIIWYIKLIDKYFNIFGSVHYFEKKGTLDFYKEFVKFLAETTAKTNKFKNSTFVSSAKNLVKELENKRN